MPINVRLTDSIACTRVKDQASSPTCWAFGTNSLFEADLLQKTGKEFDLSEMFIARYAFIDKAQRFLETNGRTYFAGGGQFHDVLRIIERYGIVPEAVYNGRPRGQMSHDHAQLDSSMKHIVHGYLAANKKSVGISELKQLNDTLDKYLGKLPSVFKYEGRTYTPKSFAQQLLRFRNDYIEFISFNDRPLYEQSVLIDKYNWADDRFYNVTLADLQSIVDTALQKGWTVGWEGDVTEPGFSYYGGYAANSDASTNYDSLRIADYISEATERDHMLHITGAGWDEQKRRWYYLKNSWGIFSKYHGYLYMEPEYFRAKTVIIVVNKHALPAAILKKCRIR